LPLRRSRKEEVLAFMVAAAVVVAAVVVAAVAAAVAHKMQDRANEVD
jgi:hypothetical protein